MSSAPTKGSHLFADLTRRYNQQPGRSQSVCQSVPLLQVSFSTMQMQLWALLVILGQVAGGPAREKRQAAEDDPFHNVPNVCREGEAGIIAHPFDETKFLQCDLFGRMYIVQCPKDTAFITAGENAGTCQSVTTATESPQASNPCTVEEFQRNHFYFPYPSDNTRFIECDMQGHPNILQCPTGLVWSEGITACIYPYEALGGSGLIGLVTPGTNTVTGGNNSPCATHDTLYFGDVDPHNFYQCDLWGNAYLNTCPAGLVWGQQLQTCLTAFELAVGRK